MSGPTTVPVAFPSRLPAFPFVVGEARSGTTLLRVMLDAHPELCVPPESYFITGLYAFRSRYERSDGSIDLPKLRRDLRGLRKFRDWDLDPQGLDRAFSRPLSGTFADAVRLLYATYAAEQDKPRYGDKTPGYVARMKLLTEMFPEARFVHIIRDVRAVALSMVEIHEWWSAKTVAEGAARWRHRVSRGRRDGAELGPERYLEVRYEDLVRDPEGEMRRVLGFLLLPWDDAVLAYAGRALARVPEGSRALHQNVARPPGPTRDWRTQISAEDLETVEAVAGSLIDELGYERAVPQLSAEAQARGAAARQAWERHLAAVKRKGRWRRRLSMIRPGRGRSGKESRFA